MKSKSGVHSKHKMQQNPSVLCCPQQAGMCMCEEGYTEVLSSGGLLDQCAPIPILEIPTGGDKKGDVKTSRAVNPTLTATTQPGRSGRTWYLQPYGPGHNHLCSCCTSRTRTKLSTFSRVARVLEPIPVVFGAVGRLHLEPGASHIVGHT